MPRVVGPFSKASILKSCDSSTRVGAVMHGVRAGLIDDLGGDTTTAQQIIAEMAALKCGRLSLLADKIAHNENADTNEHFLAIANSLRLDLMALGVGRKKSKTLDLQSYLKSKYPESAAS